MRGGAAALGSITANLALQRVIGYHVTLNFFALYVLFWLHHEILYYNSGTHGIARPNSWNGQVLGAIRFTWFTSHAGG